MRRGPRAFSRVSTGDSNIPSSCEMKDEPAFKPLQGNAAFFRVRASRCPFHLRQQTHGPSHIPVAERSFLLRCLWIIGIPLELKAGNQLSSQDDLGYTELSSSCCAELGVPHLRVMVVVIISKEVVTLSQDLCLYQAEKARFCFLNKQAHNLGRLKQFFHVILRVQLGLGKRA